MFADNSVLNHKKCTLCDIKCETCETSVTFCLSCGVDKLLYSNACIDACTTGTYQDGSNCFDCDQNCKSCINTSV